MLHCKGWLIVFALMVPIFDFEQLNSSSMNLIYETWLSEDCVLKVFRWPTFKINGNQIRQVMSWELALRNLVMLQGNTKDEVPKASLGSFRLATTTLWWRQKDAGKRENCMCLSLQYFKELGMALTLFSQTTLRCKTRYHCVRRYVTL